MEREKTADLHNSTSNEDGSVYRVKSPSIGKLLVYIIFAVIMSMGYILILIDSADTYILPDDATFSFLLEEQLLGLLVPNIIIILIVPIVWSKMPGFLLSVRNFEGHYLEAETRPTDLSGIWTIFKTKIVSGISANIGFTFILAYLIYSFLPSDLTGNDALFLSIMVMQLVPLLLSGLVPVNWVLNDAFIRYKDDKGLIHDVGEDMNKGLLRKFIGIGGLILGLDVCYQLAFNTDASFIVNWYVAGIYFVFFFILLSSGTIVTISLIYLSKFHESSVNLLRGKLAQELPVARTVVDENVSSQVVEKISSKAAVVDTRKMSKVAAILVSIAILAFCMYYVLVVIGPFGLFM